MPSGPRKGRAPRDPAAAPAGDLGRAAGDSVAPGAAAEPHHHAVTGSRRARPAAAGCQACSRGRGGGRIPAGGSRRRRGPSGGADAGVAGAAPAGARRGHERGVRVEPASSRRRCCTRARARSGQRSCGSGRSTPGWSRSWREPAPGCRRWPWPGPPWWSARSSRMWPACWRWPGRRPRSPARWASWPGTTSPPVPRWRSAARWAGCSRPPDTLPRRPDRRRAGARPPEPARLARARDHRDAVHAVADGAAHPDEPGRPPRRPPGTRSHGLRAGRDHRRAARRSLAQRRALAGRRRDGLLRRGRRVLADARRPGDAGQAPAYRGRVGAAGRQRLAAWPRSSSTRPGSRPAWARPITCSAACSSRCWASG